MSSETEMEMDESTCPDAQKSTDLCATNTSLPTKSRERYDETYKKFLKWKLEHNKTSWSENVLLAYFNELCTKYKPTSLWSMYSILRTTININNNVDISKYPKLVALLKRKSVGFESKKSKILSVEQINQFLKNAPDAEYLFQKVVIIIGISGACRKHELRNITLQHIKDTGQSLMIRIPNAKTKAGRSFVVSRTFYSICKKYMDLRPTGANNLPFFLNYQNGKCTKQSIGVNKLGSVPQKIAEYLELPEAKLYTGHCFFRRSSGNSKALKRHGVWRSLRSSTVTESSVEPDTSTFSSENATEIKLEPEVTENSTCGNVGSSTLNDDSAFNSTSANVNNSGSERNCNSPASIVSSITHKNHVNIFNNCTVTINVYNKRL